MNQKKVQKNRQGKVRVFHESNNVYTDYDSFLDFEMSSDYSSDINFSEVSSFDGFGGGLFGGGGSSSSWDSESGSDSSTCDSGDDGLDYKENKLCKDSILNAYPLDNIK